MREYTRDELLQLTPERYLQGGFLDQAGRPRGELQSDWATAAATQLLAAELAPQEFAFTVEALRMALSLHEGDGEPPLERAVAALDEALAVVGRMIRQPNNEGLEEWLEACVAEVSRPEDIPALMEHVQAVQRQHAMFAAFAPDSPSSSSRPQA